MQFILLSKCSIKNGLLKEVLCMSIYAGFAVISPKFFQVSSLYGRSLFVRVRPCRLEALWLQRETASPGSRGTRGNVTNNCHQSLPGVHWSGVVLELFAFPVIITQAITHKGRAAQQSLLPLSHVNGMAVASGLLVLDSELCFCGPSSERSTGYFFSTKSFCPTKIREGVKQGLRRWYINFPISSKNRPYLSYGEAYFFNKQLSSSFIPWVNRRFVAVDWSTISDNDSKWEQNSIWLRKLLLYFRCLFLFLLDTLVSFSQKQWWKPTS